MERIDKSWTDESQEQEPTANRGDRGALNNTTTTTTTTTTTDLTALVLTVPSVGHFCTTRSCRQWKIYRRCLGTTSMYIFTHTHTYHKAVLQLTGRTTYKADYTTIKKKLYH